MARYIVYNGAVPTTAAQVAVATGTNIKTLLQLTASASDRLTIVAWGVSFDGSAAATPGKVELLGTGTVAGGSPTAVTPTILSDGDGASATTAGFSPSSEGTITTTRVYDSEFIAPTSQYVREFSLGREPIVALSGVVRIRVHFGTTVNALAWIMWEE